MFRMHRALLLFLVGCGPAFSAGVPDAQDAAPETAGEATSDAGIEAAPSEASSDVTPSVESGTSESSDGDAATCAPHAIDAGPCFDVLADSSQFPVWVGVGGAPEAGCGGSSSAHTPAACMCDYSCACLSEHATTACVGNGGWRGCVTTGGVPVVTCTN